MKFLADMGVSQSVTKTLREWGYDAIHLREKGLQRLPDSQIVEKARLEQRIILTFDLDFADLMATSQDNLPSVVIFRLKNATPAFVIPRLTTILDECSELLESGVILIVENSRYRLRKLPID